MSRAADNSGKSREDFLELVQRLIQEYHELPAGTIIRCAARTRRALQQSVEARVLLDAIEVITRSRVANLLPAAKPPARPLDEQLLALAWQHGESGARCPVGPADAWP
jgi:hypothetical protein